MVAPALGASSAPSFVPQGLDAATNKELTEIWAQVQVRVLELAGGDWHKINLSLDIEGVLSQLDQSQKTDKASSGTMKAIKKTFNRALVLIQTVGSIVAGAASQVFGPSDLCFNALTFVIQAWQGYQGIYDQLAKLLEECANYLDRLTYYTKGGMDARLTKVACQHLQLFVEICDRTVKLRSKWTKFKALSKVFFFQEGVEDLLKSMSSLVDKEKGLVSAQTFNFASEAAVNSRENLALTQAIIDNLANDKEDQRREKDMLYRTKIILKTLAFDKNKMNNEGNEPEPFWDTIYRNYRGQTVSGTGEWIFSDPKYVAWESGQANGAPILAIEGPDQSGKSYLASTIIKHLKEKAAKISSDTRISPAYYFLEGNSREELKRAANLETVAKSLVWQLSEADTSYMKSVASKCEERREIDPRDISKYLLFGNTDLVDMNVTFFIVIDGLGDGVGEGVTRFLHRACTHVSGRVKVLLTGDPRGFQQLAKENIVFDSIHISSNNRPDVEKYIESWMDRIPALSDETRVGTPELRVNIRDRLYKQTMGDYFKINKTLDIISKLEYETDIFQAIQGAGKERSQQINEEIDHINTSLSAKEISEVNEIILWMVYSRQLLTPKQMSAAVYVKSGELSLLPLRKKFEIKYTLFEIDSNGKVDYKSKEIENFIPVRNGLSNDVESQDDAKAIRPSEVAMVKHFLHTVCPPEIYAKFRFEEYLLQRPSQKSGSIYRDDKDTGQTKMALSCLRLLTRKADKRFESLLPYARSNLVHHLSAVDLALADPECKSEVGTLLVMLFNTDSSIDALLWSDESVNNPRIRQQIRIDWLYNDDNVEVILRWLADSAVTAKISEESKTWIAGLTSNRNPEEDLLRPAAMRMATIFLQEPHFRPLIRDAFLFVLGFINKLDHRKGIAEREVPRIKFVPSVEQIDLVEKWCEKVLGAGVKRSLWNVNMGLILDIFGFTGLAERRARDALELDPLDFRASNLVASRVDPEEGIDILKPVVERLDSDKKWMKDRFNEIQFGKILFTLGKLYLETDQTDLAIQVQTKAIEVAFTDYGRVIEILSLYGDKKRWSDIIASLETIKQKSTESVQGLPELVIESSSYARLHAIILEAALKTSKLKLLEEMYEGAIKLLLERQERTVLGYVRYFYATALHEQLDRESKALAQWELALKEDIPQSTSNTALPYLITKLGPIYLQKARASGQDKEAIFTWLHKIETLLPEGVPEKDAPFPPKIYLARYYQVQGEVIKAKQITRSVVEQALEILSDDDEGNDIDAYLKFLCVFIPLGDEKNTLATLSIIYSSGDSTNFIVCDGDCGYSWEFSDEMWWCRDCINMNLCKDCYAKLHEDTLPFRICDKNHEFFHTPPKWDSKMKEIAKDHVPFGDSIIHLDQWKDEIKKGYVDMNK